MKSYANKIVIISLFAKVRYRICAENPCWNITHKFIALQKYKFAKLNFAKEEKILAGASGVILYCGSEKGEALPEK